MRNNVKIKECYGLSPTHARGRGFTLIEMMVSVSIFTMVMLVSTGALLSMVDSSRKAQAQQTAFSNMDFVLESMSRSIRVGTYYHCGEDADFQIEKDCSINPESVFAFEAPGGIESTDADQIIYRLEGGAITREDVDGKYPITSDDVTITNLTFRVNGSTPAANQQPIVQIVVSGFAGNTEKSKVSFSFQTSVTQRLFDIAD